MAEDTKKKNEETGFRIIDRRRDGRDEAEAGGAEQTEAAKAPPKAPKVEEAAPEAPKAAPKAAPEEPRHEEGVQPASFSGEEAFSQFILSLATSVYMHLGLMPGPDGKTIDKSLPLAKQSIDILGMLEAKTKGNRTTQEEALLSQVLSELRMRFVDEQKKEQK